MAVPAVTPDTLRDRRAALRSRLRTHSSLIVAYSGGVDSAYLAVAASDVLGSRVLAVTADSPSYPAHHRLMALDVAARFGFQHEFVATEELSHPDYRANGPARCYHCKNELYGRLTRLAAARGFEAIADGTNADDHLDYRPGRRAARELGVISPLAEAGLSKADVRVLAREAGIPTWDEPASACLSSRIPYHSAVTEEKLRAIEAAEEAIRALGFRMVRVRHHGEIARIEVAAADVSRLVEQRMAAAVDTAVRQCGFAYVAVDLRGYRLGSLNEGLALQPVE